ncbi:hypothetical protein G6O69_37130 [Pseudenhygromyxa sp. WMMC2535]|uniref:trypco2 family protein n=1 Tax=Pseudenhygromyxa sp. WMMC2535 TaxID=2712867 RepID=UPI0015524CB2|nr:trypco2 family protein [Pseudenhygromyxa sp. WMMC2535]NVB40312.1 hypothetical protein [Pseudenhygromyxa sp. WMMC2535]NVB43503.1 hypothetical protein [Pseudenhygromyxa sp. WMMC2535]
MVENLDQPVPLSEMIESLRLELAVAMEAGKDKAIRFDIDKVELELELALGRKTSGGGGLKFWVVTAQGEHAVDKLIKHKFKLTLNPKTKGGERVEVADETPVPGKFR